MAVLCVANIVCRAIICTVMCLRPPSCQSTLLGESILENVNTYEMACNATTSTFSTESTPRPASLWATGGGGDPSVLDANYLPN